MSVPQGQLPQWSGAPTPGVMDPTMQPVQGGQEVTGGLLQNLTNPQNALGPLQQEIAGWQQNQDLPSYDKTIQAILNVIDNACNVGMNQTLSLEVQAKAINSLAGAAHLLAQASQSEGQHIPASVNVRLEGAKLQLQQQQQQHEQAMALANQHVDLSLKQAQANQQMQMDRELHQARLHQMAHGMVQNEQQQQHEQGLAEQQQQHEQDLAQQSQNLKEVQALQAAQQPEGGNE